MNLLIHTDPYRLQWEHAPIAFGDDNDGHDHDDIHHVEHNHDETWSWWWGLGWAQMIQVWPPDMG